MAVTPQLLWDCIKLDTGTQRRFLNARLCPKKRAGFIANNDHWRNRLGCIDSPESFIGGGLSEVRFKVFFKCDGFGFVFEYEIGNQFPGLEFTGVRGLSVIVGF